jgi:hypothetical protein
MSRAGHRTKTSIPERHRVGSIGWCTPGMGMNLWGASPLSEDLASTMLTIVKTSRRQGQHREVVSEGSPSAKRRADEQESDTRLSSRVEWAPHHEGQGSARYSKSGGGVVTVQVLIRGDLLGERSMVAMGVGLRSESKDSGLPPSPTAPLAACARVISRIFGQKSAAVVVVKRAGTCNLRRTKGIGQGSACWYSMLAWPVLNGK